MKIIISPSKTQDFSGNISKKIQTPFFIKEANEIADNIKKLSKEELGLMMKIKGKLLEKTYEDYDNYNTTNTINHAISSYSGMVFKEINVKAFNEKDLDYANDHLIILSALYGILSPLDGIKLYRLDMKMKIGNISLNEFWKNKIENYFSKEDLIINLASNEFSKLIKLPMITIDFKEEVDGKYKTIGTYAKQARGMMVNYLIKNKIEQPKKIKEFSMDRYVYNKGLSSDKEIIFSRKKL
jgi:cytoplasmic iron level regulating protein YaaA (DUF328/UPF0246 family)